MEFNPLAIMAKAMEEAAIMDFAFEMVIKLEMSVTEKKENGYVVEIPQNTGCSFKIWMQSKQINCEKCGYLITNPPKSYCCCHNGVYNNNKWDCCGGRERRGAGCIYMPNHIYKLTNPVDLHCAIPFQNLDAISQESPRLRSMVSIQTECVYTSLGTELAKVTLVDFESRDLLYEKYVKPQGKVFDYDYRNTGITKEELESCDAVTFKDCQDQIFDTYIFSDTILVGYKVHNDLNLLRICHASVVDVQHLFNQLAKTKSQRNKSLGYYVHEVLYEDYHKRVKNSFRDAIKCINLVEAFLSVKNQK